MMQRLTVLSLLAVLSTVTAFEDITITEWLTKNNFTTLLDLLRTAGLDTALGGAGNVYTVSLYVRLLSLSVWLSLYLSEDTCSFIGHNTLTDPSDKTRHFHR